MLGQRVSGGSLLQDLRGIVGKAAARVEAFHQRVDQQPIDPKIGVGTMRQRLAETFGDFSSGLKDDKLLDTVDQLMADSTLHTTHPRYFGLFNPSVTPASVAADVLVAGYNPQLAAWSHAPFANEAERYTLRFLARRLGFDTDQVHANFTSGGAEANHSAIVTALVHQIPGYAQDGLVGESARPVLYASVESHHSIEKIALMSGLGREAVRAVPVDATTLRMNLEVLRSLIFQDRQAGNMPFAVVATAGTTGGGGIDPLPQAADLCVEEGLWLHVDAAWAGAACLSTTLRSCLAGIERADSVTWDAHKWLSVPMGAGMFFCRQPTSVHRAFGIATPYMPDQSDQAYDPYSTTMQWSRRFIGLKVFLSLVSLGVDGYRALIDHQVRMGDLLRQQLTAAGWDVVNDTPLPLVCFTRNELAGEGPANEGPANEGATNEGGASEGTAEEGIAKEATAVERVIDALSRENFWVSSIALAGRAPVLRACITNHATRASDIEALVKAATNAALA